MSISPVVRNAESFEDLLAIPGGDGPYRFTRMFRESTWSERRRSRRTFKLLRRTDGAIREAVLAGEKVLFLTKGNGLSFWEQWVVGWRRAIVVTSWRLLLIQLDARSRPRDLRAQLRFEAMKAVEEGRWGRIRIELRSGDRVILRGVPRADRAELRALLDGATGGLSGQEEHVAGLENLCPHCHRAVDGFPASCSSCQNELARPWLSALRSLLLPGLGNHRLGHRGFAVLEMLAAAAIWLAYLLGPGTGVGPDLGLGPDPGAWAGVGSAPGPEWLFLTLHGSDAVWTWYVARRGIYPGGDA